jgi:aryl-alcohol dehydrogenase-like predicted oxidoreductase
VAIAWQIARPSITAPIASATSVKQLDELIAAANLQLAPETIAALDAASDETTAQR